MLFELFQVSLIQKFEDPFSDKSMKKLNPLDKQQNLHEMPFNTHSRKN